MRQHWKPLAISCALLWVATVWAEIKLDAAKCIISGNPCKAEAFAEHNGGKVYFCCEKCLAAYQKDAAKHAAKANHQLVLTGQAKQAACPFSGQPTNPEAKLTISGVDVSFCCKGCLGKVAKTKEDEAKGELVFNDKAFKAGFKVGE